MTEKEIIYIVATTCLVITFITLTYLYIKLSAVRAHADLLTSENNALKNQNERLQSDNINYISETQRIGSKAEYLSQMLEAFKEDKNQNTESVKAALFNLGGELSKQLLEIHKNETKDARELSSKNLEESSKKFNIEFERLVGMIGVLSKDIEESKGSVDLIKQSLLSPITAGKLAEITLENILKSSGLRDRMDFTMQYTIKNALDNTKLRPDAIIFLPAGNLMVIDAKASKFLMDDIQKISLSKTMNIHLKALSSKEYAENAMDSLHGKGQNFSNVITLMFLPTESAIERILESDHGFIEKAWSLNIFPVGPMGLMNMLSFAKFQICEQQRIENHNAILEEVKKIIKSISTITEYSERLGNNIQSLVNNYDKFAASFNHNFLSKVKNIHKLGIAQKEKTPIMLNRYHIISSTNKVVQLEELDEN
jgi:DNA recombination protein RmuC